MAGTGAHRASTAGRPSSLVGLVKDAGRLLPKQLNDELRIASVQLKEKGVAVGIAAAFVAVALLFVSFMVVALLVALIMGIGEAVEPWLAALLVAAGFLVLAAIVGGIGAAKIKKAMPLLPDEALRGFKHDLGVVKEGTSFDPATLDVKKPKEEKPLEAEAGEEKPEVSHEELLRRTAARRDHLARIRDDLETKADVRQQTKEGLRHAGEFANTKLERAAGLVAEKAGPAGENAGRVLREKWQPLAVMAASLVALATFVRKLAKH